MISVDRSLPISLHVQIVGAIEYGIMAGTFRGGMLLPSVRELSRTLNVSPLTVSAAYRELKQNGLIVAEQGKGTYVRIESRDAAVEQSIVSLRTRFQQLLAEANALGVTPSFFAEMIRQQNDSRELAQLPIKMMMVGNSNRMGREYAAIIQQALPDGQTIDVCTFEQFEAMAPAQVDACSFYLTLPHCVARIRHRVPQTTVVLAPYLIPSETTRRNLAGLPSESNVLLVSRFRNFLPAMLEGVKSFAPHLGNIDVFSVDEKNLEGKISQCQVLIYSTGCHHLVQDYVGVKPAFEYMHVPEQRYLRDILQPAYFNFRRQQSLDHEENINVD
ncbi:hypothetical protein CAP48_17620 [Advenella sp. S44]|uniref:GntR family transcriptional regulator n=1 Tax=Advenella sp. S44 TaxID=1982755 RepID=UPI000C2A547D|nr:GntR family transcriptional regulator [Advenella sp. S44]PJX21122.1 hypothetical protein CAP48_17620 [Advenella sp. S44]